MDAIDSVKIGKYIAQLRRGRGMTQQQLADRLGITNRAVSKWETGDGLPDIGAFPALAELLGTTSDALLRGGDGGDPPPHIGDAAARYMAERSLVRYRKGCVWSLLIAAVGVVAAWAAVPIFYIVTSALYGGIIPLVPLWTLWRALSPAFVIKLTAAAVYVAVCLALRTIFQRAEKRAQNLS